MNERQPNSHESLLERLARAVGRLKARDALFSQEDIAAEAGMSARTLVRYKAADAGVAELVNSALLESLDMHIARTARRIRGAGEVATYRRISSEAGVAPETLRRRRNANPMLAAELSEIISSTTPSDIKIRRALEEIRSNPRPISYAEFARTAGLDPATLRTRLYANPALRDAVNAVILSADALIMRAVERLAATGQPATIEAVAAAAGLDRETVAARKRRNSLIRQALDRFIVPTDEAILGAVKRLVEANEPISQTRIASAASVSLTTLRRRMQSDPRIRKAVDAAIENSLSRRTAAVIADIRAEGGTITQQRIAARLGISEAALSYHRQRDGNLARLLDEALPETSAEKIRRALYELGIEGIPCTLRNIALKAGINVSTVTRAVARDPLLRKHVAEASPPRLRYATREDCLRALADRTRVYENELCNTPAALRQPLIRGGNPALLRACRRLRVALPQGPRTASRLSSGTLISSYLARINAVKPLLEDEAVALLARAGMGDMDAQEELLVRLRPMVAHVIQTDLREDLSSDTFRAQLIEHLISEGDRLLAIACSEWDQTGSFLAHARYRLSAGLREARLHFLRERYAAAWRETSDPGHAGAAESARDGRLRPDEVAAIMEEGAAFAEDELIEKRDAASGLPILSKYEKHALALSLKALFSDREFSRIFSAGTGTRWCVFLAGSLGKLGTAVKGMCPLELLFLCDASPAFADALPGRIASAMEGSWRTDGRELIIGAAPPEPPSSTPQEPGVAHSSSRLRHLMRRMLAIANNSGVALDPSGRRSRMEFRSTSDVNSERIIFELLKNCILVHESAEGTRTLLAIDVIRNNQTDSPEEAARALLNAQIAFLRTQRAGLELARRRFRPCPPTANETPSPAQSEA